MNLGLALLIPWLLVKILQGNFFSRQGLLVSSVFLSLIAFRETIEYGQTSLLVFALMLAAWYWGQRHPICGGISLGIALSKYSLTFPVALLFVYKKWLKAAIISALVQVVTAWLLALITQTSLLDIARSYVQVFNLHKSLPGVHLSASVFEAWGLPSFGWLVAFSVLIFALLVKWYFGQKDSRVRFSHITEFNLVTIIALWNLLTFYHRRYDNIIGILFIALLVLCVPRANVQGAGSIFYSLLSRSKWVVYGLSVGIGLIWVMPVYLLVGEQLYRILYTLANLVALALATWLLFRIRLVETKGQIY